MVPLGLPNQAEQTPASPFDAEAMALLNHLRFVAMACRSKPRADLFEACALLQVTRSATQEAHADALMRCLREALGQQPKLHAPGTLETSFDEAWLMQLGIACATKNEASIAFLLRSRVAPENRRLVRYLMTHVSERFSLN